MANSTTLKGLTPHEAVADALYRALVGLDLQDDKLWASAWAKENDISFALGEPLIGFDAIKKGVYDRIGALETQHTTSTVRVDLDQNAKTARLTAYAVNNHFRPGEGMKPDSVGFLCGGKYDVELVEDESDGLWKMRHWKMGLIWCTGDGSLVGM